MDTLVQILLTIAPVVHVVTCLLLILLVLVQQGKGAEMGANLAGGSGSIMGSGGGNVLTKITYSLAAVFMVTSIGLTILKSKSNKSVFDASTTAPISAPAVPTTPDAAAPVAPPTDTSSENK